MGPTCLSQWAFPALLPTAADHSDVRDEGLHVRQVQLTNHRPLLRFPFAFGHLWLSYINAFSLPSSTVVFLSASLH